MEKIQAGLVLEILGRPSEHVTSSLNSLIEKLGAEKGVKVTNKTVHEPHLVENSKDLFTTFAEIEAEFDSIANLLGIMFAYMPSNVEIAYPEKIAISNIDLSELTNTLMQRLHNYDSIAKQMISENSFLTQKLKEHAPHLFKQKQTDNSEKKN